MRGGTIMAQYKLVIAEKPSVAQSLAAVIGATARKDGYLEGGGLSLIHIFRQASLFPAPVFLPEVSVLFPYIYSYQLHRPDRPY